MKAVAMVGPRLFDAWQASDFEGWIANYSKGLVVVSSEFTLVGRAEVRKVYRVVFDMGAPDPTILESGWTGERVFIRQEEFLPEGASAGVSYAEYEVKNGKIVAVYGHRL